MTIQGVVVQFENLPDATEAEAVNYIEYVKARIKAPLKFLKVKLCADGKVDVDYESEYIAFNRLRRITGYLTSDLKTWNDAKRAEERERVKHNAKY